MTGPTQPKTPGDETADSVFREVSCPVLSDGELSDIVAEYSPFFMDGDYAFYKLDNGDLVVAPVYLVYEKAVKEAGFSTEDLRACIEELRYLLRARVFGHAQPFMEREVAALDRAYELVR